ncbi:MAG: CDP-alcohol phosphatidyltransferase family protein [Thermaceae bacterium]
MVPGSKNRPVQEFLNVSVYRPLAHLLVRLLLPTPVRPPHLVLFHTLLTFLAALWVVGGRDGGAAILLQIKTVLDNADGQLARLKGEETELGRYLDSGMDFLGNLALFLALYLRTGEALLVALGFLFFTLTQAWDFNLEHLYRKARGEPFRPEVKDPPSFWLTLFRGLYALVYAPQDRLVCTLERTLVKRLKLNPLRFWDEKALAAVVNLGLTTHLFFMGVFLALGEIRAYLLFLLLLGPYLAGVYVWRILRSIPSPRSGH